MNYRIDTHSHTIASGHAYSTMKEMIDYAQTIGLEALAITEHAVTMPGTCHDFYFHNLKIVPRQYQSMRLLLGTEANIIDYDGTIDMNENNLKGLDIVIASLHLPCIASGTKEQNTNACIGAMKHPRVSIIGHPDDGRFSLDYERLVLAAKEHHVLLELNNASLTPTGFRQNAKENDIAMLQLCKKYNVCITLSSDAHIASAIADFTYAKQILELVQFPDELIVNTSFEKLKKYLK